MGPIPRLLNRSRRHLRWLIVAAVASALVAATTIFAYNLLRPLLDGFRAVPSAASVAQHPSSNFLITHLDRLARATVRPFEEIAGSQRGALLALIVIAVTFKAILTLVARYAVARFGLATIRDLRVELHDRLLGQSQAYLRSTSIADLTTRMVADAELIRETLAERFSDLIVDSVTVIALLTYIVSLNARLTLATAVAAPLLLAPVVYLARRLRRRTRASQEHIAGMATLFDETLRGLRVVQAYSMETSVRRRFRAVANSHFKATLLARLVQTANAPAMETVGAAAGAILLAWAGHAISAGTMSVGDLSAFLVGVYGAYNPIKRLNKLNLSLQQAHVAADRIFEVLDHEPEVLESPEAIPLTSTSIGVSLRGISFAYEPDRPVLQALDLDLPAGSRVALVGASGAGKSTLAQLIPRFWDVQQGQVLVGGHDVRHLTLTSLRGSIALVTQETILFQQSIHYNITCGHEVDRQTVELIAHSAMAHDFISDLPQGYDTVIGEQGLTLSGGQRQRLAIARALLKDAPILILDEATSALDGASEQLVQEALSTLMKGRTTLIVAHRLSTIRSADTIAVLENGRIVEHGDHDSLMAANGPYSKLARISHQSPAADRDEDW